MPRKQRTIGRGVAHRSGCRVSKGQRAEAWRIAAGAASQRAMGWRVPRKQRTIGRGVYVPHRNGLGESCRVGNGQLDEACRVSNGQLDEACRVSNGQLDEACRIGNGNSDEGCRISNGQSDEACDRFIHEPEGSERCVLQPIAARSLRLGDPRSPHQVPNVTSESQYLDAKPLLFITTGTSVSARGV